MGRDALITGGNVDTLKVGDIFRITNVGAPSWTKGNWEVVSIHEKGVAIRRTGQNEVLTYK